MTPTGRPGGPAGLLARLALIFALLAPVTAFVAGVGYRQDWWGLGFAFGRPMAFSGLLEFSVYGGGLAVLLGLLAVVTGAVAKRGGAVLTGLIALGLAGAFLYVPVSQLQQARSVPPIHDISTDTQEAPEFEAVLAARAAWDKTRNPPDYVGGQPVSGDDGPTVAEAQAEAYPDIGTIHLEADPAAAFGRARAALEEMGLEIAAAEPGRGRIEATATTRFFGFKDDVVVRIRPGDNGGSLVDIRSKSRVGRSDVGANAARIRAFRDRMTGA